MVADVSRADLVRLIEACWLSADLDNRDWFLPEAAPARRLIVALRLRVAFTTWSRLATTLENRLAEIS